MFFLKIKKTHFKYTPPVQQGAVMRTRTYARTYMHTRSRLSLSNRREFDVRYTLSEIRRIRRFKAPCISVNDEYACESESE